MHNCSISRGSGSSIGALVCFVMAGIGYFCSRDYPGVEGLNTDSNGKPRPWGDRYEDEYLVIQEMQETLPARYRNTNKSPKKPSGRGKPSG